MEKLKINKKEIDILIENEIQNFHSQLEKTMGDLGDQESRKIDYNGKPNELDMKNKWKLKDPIPELLDCLAKMEEAKSTLSRLAAAQKDEETQKRLYKQYEKYNKFNLEMIREFGIVH
jgi:hypothetical protein